MNLKYNSTNLSRTSLQETSFWELGGADYHGLRVNNAAFIYSTVYDGGRGWEVQYNISQHKFMNIHTNNHGHLGDIIHPKIENRK